MVAHSVLRWLPLTMTWLYNEIKHMGQYRHVVLAQLLENTDYFPWDDLRSFSGNYENVLFRIQKKLGLRSYPSFFDRALKNAPASILHSHFGDQGWYDLPIAKKHGLKHVVTFYGYDVNMLTAQQPIWKERYRELFESADLFLCEGPHMCKSLIELGCPEEKSKVQRLGVDLEKIPFVPRVLTNGGTINVLIAGTFREKKGIPYALEAVGLLKPKLPNLRITLIGDATGLPREETEKQKILQVIDKYQLAPITRMLGFQSHANLMKEAYQHHLFLSPSVTSSDGDTEGGAPVTIIEMAASGMPVISTTNCDIPFVVSQTNRDHLVSERDPAALAAKLEEFITSIDLGRIAEANRKFVEDELRVTTCASRLEAHYCSLLS